MNELAPLHESILDDATVDQLFQDIASLTQVIEVIPKTSDRGYVPEHSIPLEDAREMLRQGAVRAVQIRYVYDGVQWWDTLMVHPRGVRVVRISHDPNEHAGCN